MKFHQLVLVVLAVMTLVHASSLVGDYVLDDRDIALNPDFHDFWSLKWFALSDRPVGRMTFAIQFALIGSSPTASHLVNIAIHALAVWGLSCLANLVVRHRFPEWSTAHRQLIIGCGVLLWAIHPLTTATVTYVVQRYESLAAAGMIWSLYFWLRAYTRFDDTVGGESAVTVSDFPNRVDWVVSLALAGFAFGSKQTSAALPLVMLLADRAVLRASWKQSLAHVLGPALLCVPVIYGAFMIVPRLLVRDNNRSTVGYFLRGIDATDYILAQPIVFLRYLKLTIWPSDLVLDYGWIPSEFTSLLWLGALGWLIILGLLVWCWRNSLVVGWVLSWALLTLATTSLIPTQDMIFEHRFYLPLALMTIVIAVAVGTLSFAKAQPRVVLTMTAVAAILLSFGTVMRNLDYVTTLRLAQVDAERQPRNPRAVYRAAAFDDNTTPEQLERGLRKAISLAKERDYFYAGTNYEWRRRLADLLFFSGRAEEAEPWYLEALEENHDKLQEAEVLMSLASIASYKGENVEASRRFEAALALDTRINDQLKQMYQAHLQRVAEGEETQAP